MSIAGLAVRAASAGLGADEARRAMDEILSGQCKDAEIASLLESMAKRGETDEELEGMLDSMMSHCVGVDLDQDSLIDVCGTGGDGAHTFNVSTSAAFIAAAAGARVAKHGNRSSSGAIGSADMFEQLGVSLDSTPEVVAGMIASHGIAFMFAPRFHPAMKNTAAARKLVKTRTALNLLGPLANPACVRRQLVGISSAAHLERIPSILAKRGATRAIGVRSANGLDELSTSSRGTAIIAGKAGTERIEVSPAELGLAESGIDEIRVGGMEEAFGAFVGAIDGTASRAIVETAALNAGAALVAAGIKESIKDGLESALEIVRSGRSAETLQSFVKSYGRTESLEEIRKK